MANALQLRRGTTTQHSTFTGLAGEVTVDTDKDTVVVHDGSTAGGIPLATEDSVSAANLLTAIKTVDGAASGLDADTLDGKQLATIESEYQSYADTAAANIVASAPSTLDTLNELAAALGDDPNFATTVTNSIATKMPLTGGTFTGNVTFGDNNKAVFGAGNDLQIYHDGTDSRIDDSGAGNLILRASSHVRLLNRTNDDFMLSASGTSVNLYSSGSAKLATTSTGVDITGELTADRVSVSDNITANNPSGYGSVELGGSSGGFIDLKTPNSDDWDARLIYNGSSFDLLTSVDQPIRLRHNGTNTLTTTNTGADITGTLTTDGLTVDGTLDIEEVYEKVNLSTGTSGTVTIDTTGYGVDYFTLNQTANRTINFTNVNANLGTGQSVTVSVLMTQGSTAYYLNAYQVDGTTVTPKWSGGSAPTGGNANGIDVYTFTIIKTANATFTVLASVTQYA